MIPTVDFAGYTYTLCSISRAKKDGKFPAIETITAERILSDEESAKTTERIQLQLEQLVQDIFNE